MISFVSTFQGIERRGVKELITTWTPLVLLLHTFPIPLTPLWFFVCLPVPLFYLFSITMIILLEHLYLVAL